MKICIYGLWHLGCVTAACVAERFHATGLDPNPDTISRLNAGEAPLFEPGLDALIQSGLANGALRFTTDIREAAGDADLVWVAFDTPVDEDDRADADFVRRQIELLFPHLRPGAVVLISSQLPVGTTRSLEESYREAFPAGAAHFAYSPENLRLGKALEVFRGPGRIVVGARPGASIETLRAALEPFCNNLIWMSVESAEMTKHALNAFLANSVAFSNEIASVCEEVGADAKQVERGLKSDSRIGPGAYLSPGAAFAGGTLARDIAFLTSMASSLGLAVPLLDSVKRSNDQHKQWARRQLASEMGALAGRRIAVLGLTYKPGTNTLRRSASVELCRALLGEGAAVTAFDPAVRQLPDSLGAAVRLANSAAAAVEGCDAVVVATEWPEFRSITAADLIDRMKTPLILDANRFLEKSLEARPPLRYLAVGMPRKTAA